MLCNSGDGYLYECTDEEDNWSPNSFSCVHVPPKLCASDLDCPPIEDGKNCDEWIASHGESDGYTCAKIEDWNYNCKGCMCGQGAAGQNCVNDSDCASGVCDAVTDKCN